MFDQTERLTSYGTIKPPTSNPRKAPPLEGPQDDEYLADVLPASSAETTLPSTLHRDLSSRQVQMIAIGGTIGTGLFLGTGRALAQGGPATMLICYAVVGYVVYITLLLLGEMATQYPVAGEFFNVEKSLFIGVRWCLLPIISDGRNRFSRILVAHSTYI
jgi:amino acid permease